MAALGVSRLEASDPDAAQVAPKPNVVFILCDDLGINDLHCYGRKDHHTPNLDRLAQQGMRFTSAYCAQPICSPSRAAILTGKTPARLHLTTFLPGRPDCVSQKVLHPEIQMQVPLEEEMLPKYFQRAGYVCGAFGKWHVGGKGFGPLEHGFDTYHAGMANTTPSAVEGGKGEYDLTAAAEKFIEANRNRPFLVYLAHNSPHIPYDAQRFRIEKNAHAFEPVYAAVIETLDDTVGRLLHKLDDLQLAGRTIVVFTSDNGGLHVPEGPHPKVTHNTPYRAGKGFVYEGGMRIPLIVRWPGHVSAGKVVEAPVINTDWVPTLLELIGRPVPSGLDGVSFAAGLTGRDGFPQRALFWHFPHYTNQGSRPSGAMRDDSWMLVEYYDEEQAELYDLRKDPSERRDLATQLPQRVAKMRAALAAWRSSVHAQDNRPNPDFDPVKYGELYVDVDASRFDPAQADQAQWEKMWQWRRKMDAVLPVPEKSKPGAAHESAAGNRPNVLLIVADDMGFSDAGCYGSEIRTPVLDGLAAHGLRFTQFYNTARCWPSRACILTGYYAQQVRRDALPGLDGGPSGKRPAWARLLPDRLRPLGYRSYHSGKWHVDGTPRQGGFDRSFDYTDTDHHFLLPNRLAGENLPLEPLRTDEGYYASTAIADQAIRQLRDHAAHYAGHPFFQYLAFTEPHFPIQAPREEIADYRDRYTAGWDELRQERWKRMIQTGIVNCALSKLDPDIVPGWNLTEDQLRRRIGPGEVGRAIPWIELTPEQKRFQPVKMAIHAAMIQRMDREIGRVVRQVQAMGAFENTLILFLSDNGASAEQMIRGDGHDPAAPPGSAKSFLCIGPGWSSAANTPLRLHKSWVHEGGITTPLIVHWPRGISARGELRHNPGHLIDLVPTILDIAGGARPQTLGGAPPPPGKSLAPVFAKDDAVTHEYLWWYHIGNRAIRVGDWKLVAAGNSPWELYDLSTDRCESKNLAADHPGEVRDLERAWTRHMEEFRACALAAPPASGSFGRKGKP